VIFENESNWRTDDLWNLVERCKQMHEYREGYHIYQNTLLLVRTGNPKLKKDWRGEVIEPPAATLLRAPKRWSNTVVVKVRSRMALKMEVLDALAHIGQGYEQDMPGSDVVCLARCLGMAIGNYSMEYGDYEWARTMSLRARNKIEVGKVAAQREIYALEEKKRGILRRARESADRIDEEIAKLQQTI